MFFENKGEEFYYDFENKGEEFYFDSALKNKGEERKIEEKGTIQLHLLQLSSQENVL